MKKLSVSAFALLAAIAFAPSAHANTAPGWYAGAGLGATFGIDPDIYNARGKFHGRDEDVNLSEMGSVGYAMGNSWRVEGEYYHNQNNIDSVKNFARGSGHVSNNIAFMNVLYDFPVYSMLTPYVGAGVGADFINVKSVGAPGIGYLKGDTLDMGYQGIAGVSAQLDRNWAVTADYRYIASFDPKVDSTAGGQGRMDNSSHNIMVGLRYTFAEPMAAPAAAPAPMPMHSATPPMVAPHRPAMAAAPAVSQNFMVFFDFNKSTITPEARKIIESAAAEYKRTGAAKITVIGHTDTVGSAGYNQKLSERRALAVEAELKRLGVEQQSISEKGVGEEGLMVPTANGVREAQNRRAEIILGK